MTGASPRSAAFDLREHFPGDPNPKDPAAVGIAFDSAAQAVGAAGGGTIYVPPGEWLLGDGESGAAIQLATAGTHLIGAGMRASRLRLAGGENRAVIGVSAPGVTIERLTVCGNARRSPLGGHPHGITTRDAPTFLTIRDVVVESVRGYGIFVRGRRDDPGVYTNILLRNVVVRDCGNDAIDFKVRNSNHPSIAAKGGSAAVGQSPEPLYRSAGPRAYLRGVAIRDHSRAKPHPVSRKSGERGVDVRGQIHIHGIEILDIRPGEHGVTGASGIVFRRWGNTVNRRTRNKSRDSSWSTLENYFVSLKAPFDGRNSRGRGVVVPKDLRSSVLVANGTVLDL